MVTTLQSKSRVARDQRKRYSSRGDEEMEKGCSQENSLKSLDFIYLGSQLIFQAERDMLYVFK